MGEEITADYRNRNPLFVGVLRGAFMFLADLIRVVQLPLQIDFMAVSSYGATTTSSGIVRILKDLDEDIKDRNVLLVEDILDTGLTLNYLQRNLQSRHPSSLEVCSFLVKEGKQRIGSQPKYCGFMIPDKFVVGYGLDFNENYRNLPFIGTLQPGIYQE